MKLNARFCSAAAIAALRAGIESGPMKASGRASILSFPVRTNSGTMLGSTSVSNARQPGHCRSTYSIIVADAFGEPRTSPCCGIPANSRWTASAPGNALVSEPRVGTVPDVDELPPPTASAIPTAAPATTSATTAPIASTFGEARRRSPLRATGGGAAACWRRFLACLPLTSHNGSPRLERRDEEEREHQSERRQRQRRDRHVAELVDPLDAATARRRDPTRERFPDDPVLDQQVVDGDARAGDGQWQQVTRRTQVVEERR